MCLAFGFINSNLLDSSADSKVAEIVNASVLIGTGALCYWIVRAIPRYVVWPRMGYFLPQPTTFWRTSNIVLVLVIMAAAIGAACLVASAELKRPADQFNIASSGFGHEVSIACAIAVLVVCAASYAYWFLLVGKRECLWKWIVVVLLVAGLLAIGLGVHGNVFKVLAPAALLTGTAWLISGAATLVLYVRDNKRTDEVHHE
jgi:uncharacterized protein with PQ loop repeat